MESSPARAVPQSAGAGGHRRERPRQSWWTLLAGAAICAAVLVIAWAIIGAVRNGDWSANARNQAKLFVYASPVLDNTIGNVSAVNEVAERRVSSDPAVYAVDFKVDGRRRNGKVEVDLTRQAPEQWVVSAAELKLPHRSVDLY